MAATSRRGSKFWPHHELTPTLALLDWRIRSIKVRPTQPLFPVQSLSALYSVFAHLRTIYLIYPTILLYCILLLCRASIHARQRTTKQVVARQTGSKSLGNTRGFLPSTWQRAAGPVEGR